MSEKMDQALEYAQMFERLRHKFPDVFRHLVGLIRAILR